MYTRMIDMSHFTDAYKNVIFTLLRKAGFRIEQTFYEDSTHCIYAESEADIKLIDSLFCYDILN